MSSSLQLLGRGTCTVFQPSPLASLLSTRLALLPFFVDVSVLWLLHVLSWCACCSVSSSLCNKMEGRHRGCFHFLGCLFARGSPPLCLSASLVPSCPLLFFPFFSLLLDMLDIEPTAVFHSLSVGPLPGLSAALHASIMSCQPRRCHAVVQSPVVSPSVRPVYLPPS